MMTPTENVALHPLEMDPSIANLIFGRPFMEAIRAAAERSPANAKCCWFAPLLLDLPRTEPMPDGQEDQHGQGHPNGTPPQTPRA